MSANPDSPANQQAQKLEEALQRVRAADAELFDVRAKVSDLRYLRLDALRERLEALAASSELAQAFLTLRTLPTDPPRLIVDDSSHIVMHPDPRTYVFEQDGPDVRQVLIESADVDVVEEKVADYIAHRLLSLQRAGSVSEAEAPVQKPGGAGPMTLLSFWIAGAAMGAAVLYAYLNPEVLERQSIEDILAWVWQHLGWKA